MIDSYESNGKYSKQSSDRQPILPTKLEEEIY